MKLKVHDTIEIECPDRPYMVRLVESLDFMQAYRLAQYQKQPKNWPEHGNIPTYCLYMGSGEFDSEKVDFYHYEDGPKNEHYSTGIVNGNEPGDYRSGWMELGAKRDFYREHMRREYMCGLLTVDDLAVLGVATLCGGREDSDSIRPMRNGFRMKPYREDVVRCSEWSWFLWFLVVWLFIVLALVPGCLAILWWLEGIRNWGVVGLGFAGLVAVFAGGWWTTRNPVWRKSYDSGECTV